MKASLVFPHQLYLNHPALHTDREVWMIEDALYFTQYPFHKQKILLHRASMKSYERHLRQKQFRVTYCQSIDYLDLKSVFDHLQQAGVQELHVVDPTDFLLHKRLTRLAAAAGMQIRWYPSPNFLTPEADFDALADSRKGYLMARFYANQRRHMGILLQADGTPVGGKWSFDTENRKKVPKGTSFPQPLRMDYDPEIMREALAYVHTHFAHHYGQTEGFDYPVTFAQASALLDDFIERKLTHFGDYEDAMVKGQAQLWHSVLTPALNIGLIQPDEIVTRVLEAHARYPLPLNSLEGFIRQIIGWREFMRLMYLREGVKIRNGNHFGHTRALPESFWKGTTGLLPFDDLLAQLDQRAYSHHIGRLMVAGNLMLLCGIHPDEVYRWFMALYIDSYDWVMVPNVYSMSQYADGGFMTTKPYVSGSAYL
ncbi:MAG: cryptochrome/photolyase family protein, partial [Bacteroidetes bacterium]